MEQPIGVLTHRPTPVSDHIGHYGRRSATGGQALKQEAQEIEPVLHERVRDLELLQHVCERVLEAESR